MIDLSRVTTAFTTKKVIETANF